MRADIIFSDIGHSISNIGAEEIPRLTELDKIIEEILIKES